MKQHALELVTKGFASFPLAPRSKVPAIKGGRGCLDATLRSSQIETWWDEYPEANIGIATGAASGNLLVIDLDGPEGLTSWSALEREHGETPTLMAVTGTGLHVYFRSKHCKNSAKKIAKGIDTRGDGGYVMAPGSIHPNGMEYVWMNDVEIADAPAWLDALMKPAPAPPSAIVPFHPELGSAYADASWEAIIERIETAPKGTRNDQLNASAFSAGRLVTSGLMRREDAEDGLMVAAQACGLGETESRKTIKSGLDSGSGKPVVLSERSTPVNGHTASTAYTALPTSNWPIPLGEAAMHGLVGDVVRAIDPHTEADMAAVLVQFLTGFGSMCGRHSYFSAGADRHYPNLFTVVVGATAKGRKGSSLSMTRAVLNKVDPRWDADCVQSGLSSGEGLIWAVRDPILKALKKRSKRNDDSETEEVDDPGVSDKRLLVVEEEFASVLRVAGRDGNTLSTLIRNAWGSGKLQTLTKNTPARATDAHISIIGHVTADELRGELTRTDSANGFANRHLWICSQRSKRLPDGGAFHTVDLYPLAKRVARAIEYAKADRRLERDEQARDLWWSMYDHLTNDRPGLYGAITGRAEAQVVRLSLVYALLDESNVVRIEHLQAALEVWRYADESARYVFGDALGNPVADQILEWLRGSDEGLTRNDIRERFQRNKKSPEIGAALAMLERYDLAEKQMEETGGRTAERWMAVRGIRGIRGKVAA